jgi:hypothetical protein
MSLVGSLGKEEQIISAKRIRVLPLACIVLEELAELGAVGRTVFAVIGPNAGANAAEFDFVVGSLSGHTSSLVGLSSGNKPEFRG